MRLLADYAAILTDTARILARGTWAQRRRRLRFLALFVLFWPTWIPLCWICLGLDHLLFPGFRKVVVDRPLFVVGNMRTGSTMVQRLLSQPGCGYTTFRTLDMFLPSVLQRRVAGALGRWDAALGGWGRRGLEALDHRLFAEFSKIHPMGLFQPEEDDFLFFLSLSSAAMAESFPEVRRFRRFIFGDAMMPPTEADRRWRRYRRMVQRHLHAAGPGLRFLSKNPLFSGKIGGLQRAFPDARFLYLVRDPRSVVPSTASMLHFVWWDTGALDPREQAMDFVLDICRCYYGPAWELLEGLEPGRATSIRFEELIAEPASVLGGALAALGQPPSPGLAAALASLERRAPHRSEHRYDLEGWGLDEDRLRAVLPDAFERWEY